MRLIDADALCAYLNEWSRKLHAGTYRNDAIIMDVLTSVYEYIANMPTIDAEPVTYCNMCKHYETDTGFCQYHGHGMHWDDFCSCGAKMMEVQDD